MRQNIYNGKAVTNAALQRTDSIASGALQAYVGSNPERPKYAVGPNNREGGRHGEKRIREKGGGVEETQGADERRPGGDPSSLHGSRVKSANPR